MVQIVPLCCNFLEWYALHMRPEHEAMYRRTTDSLMRSIRAESFTPEAVPRIVSDLRMELGQCIELGLISPEFYSERMEVLGRVLELVEDGAGLEV